MILVYSDNITPRLKYTLDLIFREVLQAPYLVTDDYKLFLQSNATRVNYTNRPIENTFHLAPAGLLEESEISEQTIHTATWQDLPVLFADNNPEIPFDLFSAVFYLVSRYEEYLSFQPDKHKRFEADQSIAWKNGFLHLPVVDLWCKAFARIIGVENECPGIMPSNYKFQLTIDVDQAWTFKNKGTLLSAGALAKSILKFDFSRLKLQIQILTRLVPDPADSFDYLAEKSKKLSQGIKYFILFGNRGRYDHNIPTNNKNFQKLIQKLAEKNTPGIHPSYASNSSFHILQAEFKKLSEIVKREIKSSRQHFLLLKMPETYRNLIQLGIGEDFTMGYGSQTGFRAGIARSFYFYDLQKEQKTDLRIIPFEAMDRTLLTYLRYSPSRAKKEFEYYTRTIKDVGGLFVCLWHNTSLGDRGEWKGWKTVFEEMLNQNL
jgi:hypothetical protein